MLPFGTLKSTKSPSDPVTALDTRPLFSPVEELGPGPYVQLWPHRHGTDAMFAAALQKHD